MKPSFISIDFRKKINYEINGTIYLLGIPNGTTFLYPKRNLLHCNSEADSMNSQFRLDFVSKKTLGHPLSNIPIIAKPELKLI